MIFSMPSSCIDWQRLEALQTRRMGGSTPLARLDIGGA